MFNSILKIKSAGVNGLGATSHSDNAHLKFSVSSGCHALVFVGMLLRSQRRHAHEDEGMAPETHSLFRGSNFAIISSGIRRGRPVFMSR